MGRGTMKSILLTKIMAASITGSYITKLNFTGTGTVPSMTDITTTSKRISDSSKSVDLMVGETAAAPGLNYSGTEWGGVWREWVSEFAVYGVVVAVILGGGSDGGEERFGF
ncbi:hypothetical protein AKJ16_DCAP23231 [Drosera capensis]